MQRHGDVTANIQANIQAPRISHWTWLMQADMQTDMKAAWQRLRDALRETADHMFDPSSGGHAATPDPLDFLEEPPPVPPAARTELIAFTTCAPETVA